MGRWTKQTVGWVESWAERNAERWIAKYRKGHEDQIGHCKVRTVVTRIPRYKSGKEIAKHFESSNLSLIFLTPL